MPAAFPSPLLVPLTVLQTLVDEFRVCLEQESRALASWPPLGLWPVQEEKVRLVRDLEQAHLDLQSVLKANGQSLADLATQPVDVAQRWNLLRARIADCQRINRSNEQCLARQQQALRQSLDLLVRKLDRDITYGRQGHCQSGRRVGRLGLA